MSRILIVLVAIWLVAGLAGAALHLLRALLFVAIAATVIVLLLGALGRRSDRPGL